MARATKKPTSTTAADSAAAKKSKRWQSVPAREQVTPSKRPTNPNEWLFLNPLGPMHDFVFGVLRRDFRSFRNTALEFGSAKLRPVALDQAEAAEAQTSAYNHEVLLPTGADDVLLNPFVLLERFDSAALEWKQPLLISLTLSFPLADRMHEVWECARAFARREFCSRSMAALVIQHAPFLVGSTNPPHIHILAPVRRLKGGLGWADYVDGDLVKDRGQAILFEAWEQFRNVWM